MSKVHPVIARIQKHKGEVVMTVPLIDSILYVAVVKSDLIRQLKADPEKCDEISLYCHGPGMPMYVDRGGERLHGE